jgi:predicted nucleic acid-binding protein
VSNPVLIDTSAWVEYLRATGSRHDLAVASALRSPQGVLMPAVVLQEVLQGARSPSHFMALQTALEAIDVFEPEDWPHLHAQAALLYARCRWQGLTVRNPIDCVVAACALEADLPLLARDADFVHLQRIAPALQLM